MILRNFLTTLRRFKMASGLNIVGLSVAFAAFILILMQVSYERGFDRGYPSQVYRVEIKDSTVHAAYFSRPAVDVLLAGSPAIAHGTMQPCYGVERYVSVERNGTKEAYIEPYVTVYPGEAEVFGYDFVEGDPRVFDDHTRLAIPLSMARRMFGDGSAVGQFVTFEDKESAGGKLKAEVGAVYRDFPANSSVSNSIKQTLSPEENLDSWGNQNYWCFVTLWPGSDPAEAARRMTDHYNGFGKPDWAAAKRNFVLQPIEEVYYDTTVDYDTAPKGNRTTMRLLLSIALLVIGIAGVNFVNFATSLTPLRIKSINTRKVLGSSVGALRAELVVESVGIALLGFGLGLGWVYLVGESGFNDLISGGVSFSTYSDVIWTGLAVAFGVGIVAGIYPAIYTTSFPPALVLKGSFGLSPRGRKLRTALIGFQFVVSLGLIVAAMFLQLQNGYMRHLDTGMNREQIAIVDLSSDLARPQRQSVLVNRLKEDASVEDVAFSSMRVGTQDVYMRWGRPLSDGRTVHFTCIPVSWNFLRVMGIPILEGRDFEEGDEQRTGTYIFNRTAMREFNLTLDDLVPGHQSYALPIVGVMRDFNFASLRSAIEPMCLYQFGKEPWQNLGVAYVKIKGDPFAGAAHIKRTLAELDPLYPAEIEFYDTAFNTLYQKELKVTTLITTFSLLAVVLSLMGVFGLVVFETQYRRKEIGVRKVLGATVAEVLAMFNRRFVRLVLVCFVVAVPLAWYGVREWLSTFAYRTPIYWWVFAVSLAIVLFITLLTVTIQSWRAATANPVSALKAE